MRSSGSKLSVLVTIQAEGCGYSVFYGNVESFRTNGPVENGFPPKEDEECVDVGEVRHLAEQVVENVVKRASRAANSKGCGLQKLPTIQIDSAPSPPNSPNEEEEPLDADQVDLNWEEDQQEQEVASESDDLREFLKLYIEDLLLQAMVIAQKKLQFVGVAEEDESEDEALQTDSSLVPAPPTPEGSEKEAEEEEDDEDARIREAAEKVVEEVLSKATELVAQRLEQLASLEFPGIPSFQFDMVKSAPPSPELEDESPPNQKKWTFKLNDEDANEDEKATSICLAEKESWITFDDAPEDVRDAATRFIKEIVGKAVAMAEEKAVPTVPFNFEDVDLIKTSGPWYIRAREALVRVLRTACFCTPRRHDS